MKISEIYNVGVSPSSLIIKSNEKTAYVCNSNNYGIVGTDSVSVLNLRKKNLKCTIYDSSFNQPYRAAFSHCEKYVYVTNSNSPSIVGQNGTVSVINTKTNKVEKVLIGFDGPTGIVVTKNRLYVTNYGATGGVGSGNGKTISVVDIKTGNIIDTIITDLAPAALVISPCRKFLYSLNYTTGLPNTGTINVICRKTNKSTHTIPGLFGPFAITVSDCNIAYVTNFGSNNFVPFGTFVSVIDMKTKSILKNIEIGIQPSGICLKDKYLYVIIHYIQIL